MQMYKVQKPYEESHAPENVQFKFVINKYWQSNQFTNTFSIFVNDSPQGILNWHKFVEI